MIDDIQKIDLIEKLKNRLIELHPDIQNELNETPKFTNPSKLDFFKQKYLSILFDINDEIPAGRRALRQIVKQLEIPIHSNLQPGTVAEISAPYQDEGHHKKDLQNHRLWKKKEQLLKELDRIDPEDSKQNSIIPELIKANHLRDQIELIQKELALLNGMKAFRYLEKIGQPVILPDSPRRTFFYRLGFTQNVEKDQKWPDEFFKTCYSLSQLGKISLPQLNLITGYYTGSLKKSDKFSPICGQKPKCPSCSVQQYCIWYRYNERSDQKIFTKSRIKDKPLNQRPRERLAKSGAESLSEIELLAILIRTGSGKNSALDLAGLLLEQFGNLSRIDQATIKELSSVPGIGPAKATELKAALELGKRLFSENSEEVEFSDSYNVYLHYRARLGPAEQENFLILLLNSKNRLIREINATRGTLEASLIDPRQAFKDAIRDSASAVIFVHNHPSGEPDPSPEDIEMTNRLVRAGALLGIRVLDHVIVAKKNFYSFAANDQI